VHAAPQNEEEIMRHAGTFFSLIWFPFFVAWIVMLAPQWKRKVRFIGWMRANRTSLAQLRWALAGLWITCLIVGGALAPPEPATKEVSAPTVSAPTPVALFHLPLKFASMRELLLAGEGGGRGLRTDGPEVTNHLIQNVTAIRQVGIVNPAFRGNDFREQATPTTIKLSHRLDRDSFNIMNPDSDSHRDQAVGKREVRIRL
jgi:hypothetical protein